MDEKDVRRLMDLLDTLCTNTPDGKRARRDSKTVYAWSLALEPYSYDEVKEGALAHVRESRLYPSISEIVAKIPQKATAPEAASAGGKKDISWMKPFIVKQWSEYSDQHAGELHAAGLHTYGEAQNSGETWKGWIAETGEELECILEREYAQSRKRRECKAEEGA